MREEVSSKAGRRALPDFSIKKMCAREREEKGRREEKSVGWMQREVGRQG
jgi:hypothetical protein